MEEIGGILMWVGVIGAIPTAFTAIFFGPIMFCIFVKQTMKDPYQQVWSTDTALYALVLVAPFILFWAGWAILFRNLWSTQ